MAFSGLDEFDLQNQRTGLQHSLEKREISGQDAIRLKEVEHLILSRFAGDPLDPGANGARLGVEA